jgi:hypothetical protein
MELKSDPFAFSRNDPLERTMQRAASGTTFTRDTRSCEPKLRPYTARPHAHKRFVVRHFTFDRNREANGLIFPPFARQLIAVRGIEAFAGR